MNGSRDRRRPRSQPRMSEPVELEMILVFRKGAAVLVQPIDDDTSVWLPLSQIKIDPPDADLTDKVTVTLPEWLAIKEGLV